MSDEKRTLVCACAHNQPALNRLYAYYKRNNAQNGDKALKQRLLEAMKSVKAYPIPILSMDDALELEGVGNTFALEIMRAFENSSKEQENVPVQKQINHSHVSTTDTTLNIEKITQTIHTREKLYLPETGKAPWFIMLALYHKNGSKKSEIELYTNNLILTSPHLECRSFKDLYHSALKTLRDRDLVLVDSERRVSLTAAGAAVANTLNEYWLRYNSMKTNSAAAPIPDVNDQSGGVNICSGLGKRLNSATTTNSHVEREVMSLLSPEKSADTAAAVRACHRGTPDWVSKQKTKPLLTTEQQSPQFDMTQPQASHSGAPLSGGRSGGNRDRNSNSGSKGMNTSFSSNQKNGTTGLTQEMRKVATIATLSSVDSFADEQHEQFKQQSSSSSSSSTVYDYNGYDMNDCAEPDQYDHVHSLNCHQQYESSHLSFSEHNYSADHRSAQESLSESVARDSLVAQSVQQTRAGGHNERLFSSPRKPGTAADSASVRNNAIIFVDCITPVKSVPPSTAASHLESTSRLSSAAAETERLARLQHFQPFSGQKQQSLRAPVLSQQPAADVISISSDSNCSSSHSSHQSSASVSAFSRIKQNILVQNSKNSTTITSTITATIGGASFISFDNKHRNEFIIDSNSSKSNSSREMGCEMDCEEKVSANSHRSVERHSGSGLDELGGLDEFGDYVIEDDTGDSHANNVFDLRDDENEEYRENSWSLGSAVLIWSGGDNQDCSINRKNSSINRNSDNTSSSALSKSPARSSSSNMNSGGQSEPAKPVSVPLSGKRRGAGLLSALNNKQRELEINNPSLVRSSSCSNHSADSVQLVEPPSIAVPALPVGLPADKPIRGAKKASAARKPTSTSNTATLMHTLLPSNSSGSAALSESETLPKTKTSKKKTTVELGASTLAVATTSSTVSITSTAAHYSSSSSSSTSFASSSAATTTNLAQAVQVPVKEMVSLSASVEYEVVLIVDKRETRNQFIQTKMVELNIPCELSNLAVGDFLWIARPKLANYQLPSNMTLVANEDTCDSVATTDQDEVAVDVRDMNAVVLDCVAERKSITDLASSIIDGRYTEQKSRLRASGVRSCVYLVEGENYLLNPRQKAVTKETLKTAMAAIHAQSEMHVMRTRDMDHTVVILQSLHRQIARRFQQGRCGETFQTFPNFQKLWGKKSAATIKQQFGHQLRQILGCSKYVALALMKEYGTTSNFAKQLEAMGRSNAIYKLANMVKVGAAREQGKDPRIGNKLAERIWNVYCEDY